ncbi:MAG: LapA family protein [Acidimicrobiia bacterium]|nr:LapA family protein [Acidimicrobiia bacterium]
MSDRDDKETRESKPKREVARLIALAVLTVALAAFVIDNTQSVRVGFVFDERNPPLIWVLVVTLLLGALIGRLASWLRNR